MAQTNWERMTPEQKVTAAAVDIMHHENFVLLSGVVMMGKIFLNEDFVTAATDGLDCYYSPKFMSLQDRAQHRWVVLHENFHKALHHCVDYVEVVEKYPQLSNIAQDFVVNALIDELDPGQEFAKRPTGISIYLDTKYYGWSFIEVLKDLLKNAKNDKGKGKGGTGGGTGGTGQVFDTHITNPNAKQITPQQEAEVKKMQQQIQDALHQGKLTAAKMAGRGKGSSVLDALLRKRTTDWKSPLRMFMEQIVSGYDNSRFCPPNKRFMPLGILMPSHFSETTGEIAVLCDTSGSMGGVYPIVFGEIARIAESVKPSSLRVIWWDGEVQGEQIFKAADYEKLASLMKPSGGGGTSPGCVVHYIAEKGYKPKAGIWLTDGYLDGSDAVLPFPVLWGVVDNESFIPPQGKKINISSAV